MLRGFPYGGLDSYGKGGGVFFLFYYGCSDVLITTPLCYNLRLCSSRQLCSKVVVLRLSFFLSLVIFPTVSISYFPTFEEYTRDSSATSGHFQFGILYLIFSSSRVASTVKFHIRY